MTPDLSPLRLIAYRALRSLPSRSSLVGPPAMHLARPATLLPRPAMHLGRPASHLVRPATHLVRVILTADSHLVLTPDTGALPGGQVLQGLMNGLDGWALALSLVGLVIGAAAWALGSHGQNYQQSFVGRRAVLISGFAALLIGAGRGSSISSSTPDRVCIELSVVGDLPHITANPCSSVASSLAGAGLGTVCQVTTGVTHAATSIASSVVGFGANSVLNALGSWVSDGASWLLAQIGKVIADTTTIDLGASWFTDHYQIMAVLSGAVIMPMLLMGIMQSIYRQNSSTLIRSVLVNVPLALLLTAVAVKLVQLGLALTDDMSSAISQGAGLNSGHFLASVAKGLSNSSADGQPAAPAFVVFVGGLVVVFGALMVWVELLIRAAAVYVAVLFLPLALASLAWPAIAHWCRRLVDTLVALVLGKFVIVAVLSLAAGALAGGNQGGSTGGGFAAVLAGAALLLFAAFAPWALFRLLPFLEAGAVGHLESLSHRAHQTASAPAKSLAHTAMGVAGAGLFHARGGGGDLLKGSLGAGAGAGRSGLSGLGGSGSAGGSGSGSGGGAGGDDPTSGGGGSPGTGPDTGPSSAESTGVGTMDSPGAGIPMWTPNPSATAIANRGSAPESTGSENSGAASTGPASTGPASTGPASTGPEDGNRPLPQQTGALVTDSLGRDALGVRLISRPISPSDSGSPPSVRPPSSSPFPPQDPGALERGDGGDFGGF